MSYDLMVYVQKKNLPAAEELSWLLDQFNPAITLPAPLDLQQQSGFFPVSVDGKDSGFEVSMSAVTEEDVEEYQEDLGDPDETPEAAEGLLKVLQGSDAVVLFHCKNELEIRAALSVAELIARRAHGTLVDPQKNTQDTY